MRSCGSLSATKPNEASSPITGRTVARLDAQVHAEPGRLILHMFGAAKRRRRKLAPLFDDAAGDLLLNGTVRTNGHELQVLAWKKKDNTPDVPVPANPTAVIGLDPGRTIAGAAAGFDVSSPSEMLGSDRLELHTTRVSAGYLCEPMRRDRHRREATKTKEVEAAELRMRSNATMAEWEAARSVARAFYNALPQAVGTMRARREQESRLARATHAVLACHPRAGAASTDEEAAAGTIVAWGNGFAWRPDTGSKHMKLHNAVRDEARRRRLAFVVVNEHRTSRTCATCGSDRLKAHGIRHRECLNCRARLHRDTNAAVNIGIAAAAEAKSGVRPPHLAFPGRQ